MKLKTHTTTTLIGASLLTLAACSPNNPLANPLAVAPKKQSATFLVAASQHAEKTMGLNDNGFGFRNCMNGKENKKICARLYSTMLAYARQQTHSKFKSLTKSELTNPTIWKKLKMEYQRSAFDSID